MTPEQRAAKRERDARYRAANREKLRLAAQARYAEKSVDILNQMRAAYHEQSPEEREVKRARDRAWRDANREKVRESNAAWVADNPERAAELKRMVAHNRRARERGLNSVSFTDTEMLNLYGSNCHICGGPIDLTAPRKSGAPGWQYALHREHVIALANGGENTLENCRPAHGICNLRKSFK